MKRTTMKTMKRIATILAICLGFMLGLLSGRPAEPPAQTWVPLDGNGERLGGLLGTMQSWPALAIVVTAKQDTGYTAQIRISQAGTDLVSINTASPLPAPDPATTTSADLVANESYLMETKPIGEFHRRKFIVLLSQSVIDQLKSGGGTVTITGPTGRVISQSMTAEEMTTILTGNRQSYILDRYEEID